MVPSIPLQFLLWVSFLYIGALKFSSCIIDAKIGCIERERQALIKFKQSLKDPSNRLSSWAGEDCCRWTGIRCNNRTGHVTILNLRNTYQPPMASFPQDIFQVIIKNDGGEAYLRSCLSGEINPSLLELKYLNYLDLSMNHFGGIEIPKFIGSLKELRYLNLSRSGFGGLVPHELGNLSSLRYLDINNDLYGFINAIYPDTFFDLRVDSLNWLSHLSSLQHLDMGSLDLSMIRDWLHTVNMLPSISNLRLSGCMLGSVSTSLLHVNFTLPLSFLDLSANALGPSIPAWLSNISSLLYLDLGSNHFRDFVPTTIGNLCNLKGLYLSWNYFSGELNMFNESLSGCIKNSLEDLDLRDNGLDGDFPDWLGQLTNLKFLDLSSNHLTGPIPASLGRLSSLRELRLNDNVMNGTISESLGQLSHLVYLDIHDNSLEGVLSEMHFTNLKRLETLHTYSNSLVLNVSSTWVPPFQLKDIIMDGCRVGPQFPSWLRTQKELCYLSFSNASISDTIPNWFWDISPHIQYIDFSHNQVSGVMFQHVIGRSLNCSNCLLPNILSNLIYVDLSHNSISGAIFTSIGEMMPKLMHLSISSNYINGTIPLSICKMKFLTNLYLSKNRLTAEIPQCFGDLDLLRVMDLRNNSLYGDLPSSLGHLSRLRSLHLSNNVLSGELPPSLGNFTNLITLDLGENGFLGKIPTWIGELTSLGFLVLRSNKFEGGIPPQLSQLSNLQLLDLALNNLSGTIPTSFGNFSAMAVTDRKNDQYVLNDTVFGYEESIWVHWKGRQSEYTHTVSLVMNIDLSSNNLSGEIPKEITILYGLQSLNLSRNHLIGNIPEKIGNLRWIESLDLSRNQLSGVIPQSLSNLTSLNHLNLSYNNLSGRIPSGNQLDTLDDSSIYIGNHDLCGTPLPKNCPRNEKSHDPELVGDKEEDEKGIEIELFFITMGPGFVVGFWIVCGPLLFKKSWRIAYYLFFDKIKDWLYVIVARKMAKFQSKRSQRNYRKK